MSFISVNKNNSIIFIISILLLLAYKLAGSISADPDLFARLAVGKYFYEFGITSKDPFAFSPLKSIWVDHEWLAGSVFYLIHQYFGDLGLVVFRTSIAIATAWLLIRSALIFNTNLSNLIFIGLGLFECTYIWSSVVRAQVFTYFFLAYFLWALACYIYYNKKKPLLLMLIIFPFWYNLHGGFVAGLGLISIFIGWQILIVKKDIKNATLFILTILVLSIFTPYQAFEFWNYIIDAITMRRASISEWQPIQIFSTDAMIINLFSISILFGFFLSIKSKIHFLQLGFFLVSAYQAYSHNRFLAIFIFCSITICIELLTKPYQYIFSFLVSRYKNINLITAGTLYIFIFTSFIISKHPLLPRSLDYSSYPVKAMNYIIEQYPNGNILTNFNVGSYVLWRGYLNFKVSIDGRYEELYPDSTLELNHYAYNSSLPDNSPALNKLKPDFILCQVDTSNSCLSYPNFELIYEDKEYKLFKST